MTKKALLIVALIWAAPLHSLSDDMQENATAPLNDSEDNGNDTVPSNSNASNKTTGGVGNNIEEKVTVRNNPRESSTAPKDGSKNKQHAPIHDDEQTYLDLFGERAKELLTQHIIPTTDASCRWDWRMGRCEPYCECGYYFLWGDYHLGRSCRLRSKFTPVPSERGAKASTGSLQDAWQQWADHMDDPDAFASFVDSGNKAKTSRNEAKECSLDPESRYTQGVYYLTKFLGHGTVIFHHFMRMKHHAVRVASDVLIHGKHKFYDSRENACRALKRVIQERERERNQPVVLTKRGSIWIRRLCGAKNATGVRDVSDELNEDPADECIGESCV